MGPQIVNPQIAKICGPQIGNQQTATFAEVPVKKWSLQIAELEFAEIICGPPTFACGGKT